MHKNIDVNLCRIAFKDLLHRQIPCSINQQCILAAMYLAENGAYVLSFQPGWPPWRINFNLIFSSKYQ